MIENNHDESDFRTAPMETILGTAMIYTRIRWPLSIEYVDQIAAELGWTRSGGDTRVRLSTNYPVNRQIVLVSASGGELNEVSTFVTDCLPGGGDLLGTGVDRSPVKTAFRAIRQELAVAYGPWSISMSMQK